MPGNSIKGGQHCLVVKGERWEAVLRAPKGQGEQEMQEQGFFCSSQCECGGANIPWQLWAGPQQSKSPHCTHGELPGKYFYAAREKVLCWRKEKMWGGRSSKEELRTAVQAGPAGWRYREQKWGGRKVLVFVTVFITNSSLFGNNFPQEQSIFWY